MVLLRGGKLAMTNITLRVAKKDLDYHLVQEMKALCFGEPVACMSGLVLFHFSPPEERDDWGLDMDNLFPDWSYVKEFTFDVRHPDFEPLSSDEE